MDSREDIETEIISFYKQFYNGETWDRSRSKGVEFIQLVSHKALLIEKPFSKEEIKEAMFSLMEDKALGQNGFQIVFYRKF